MQSKLVWAMAYTWRPIFTLPEYYGYGSDKIGTRTKKTGSISLDNLIDIGHGKIIYTTKLIRAGPFF